MPYIKQMWRSEYNLVIKTIEDNVEKAIKYLKICFKNRKLEEIDGCMNYVITQIIRNRHFITKKEGEFIRGAIFEVYKSPLSYFSINRFNGLIFSIVDELGEREWDTAQNISFLVKLKLLFRQTFIKDYEKKKRKENGDLEEVI